MNVRPWIEGRLKSGALFEVGDAVCSDGCIFSEAEELSSRLEVCDWSTTSLPQATDSARVIAIKIMDSGFKLCLKLPRVLMKFITINLMNYEVI